MRTELLKILSFIFLCQISFAQSTQWVKQIGANGYSIKVYGDYFYITGYFEDNVMFDSIKVTSKGRTDIYLAKYSINGNLNWVKTAGGELHDEGFSLIINPLGDNIYATGFMHDAAFEDTTIEGYPFFIANYDSSGKLNWARSLISSGGGGASSIASDNSGNLYITGSAFGLHVPDSLNFIYSCYFLIKYDQSGTPQWLKGTNHTTNSIAVQPAKAGITCDIYNNVYVTGTIQSEEIQFDSTHILIPEGDVNAFVCKYDSSGNVLAAMQSKGPGLAIPNSITVDNTGNIYLTGTFDDTVQFDDVSLVTSGSWDVFTVKYNQYGQVLWAKKAGSENYESGRSIKIDHRGNVHITGINSFSAYFDDLLLEKGGVFIAKYDSEGEIIDVNSVFYINENIPVWGSDFLVNDFELINDDEYILTGFINTSVYFNTQKIDGLGNDKIFLARFSNPVTSIPAKSLVPHSIILSQNYPNPFNPTTSIRYSLPKDSDVTLKIYDINGRLLSTLIHEKQSAGTHNIQWNASSFPSGIYFYRLQTNNYQQMRKCLLVK